MAAAGIMYWQAEDDGGIDEMADCTDRNVERVRLALLQQLESLHRSGVRQLARPPVPQSAHPAAAGGAGATSEPAPSRRLPAARPAQSPPPSHVPATSPELGVAEAAAPRAEFARPPSPVRSPAASPTEPSSAAERLAALEAIGREVVHCARCAELAATRTQTVLGVGNPLTRLCFLGEAPGEEEDRRGEPFVGRAGQLLNKIIEACTLKREDVYILNVLKCRPPGNRTPAPEEVAHCRGYFERQLEILQPEFICCLGAVAAQALLRTTRSVGALRGRFHQFRTARVLVTYHPSYLLRAPEKKRETWEDMKLLMREMGLELPAR
jgi:uracil-DNA glycosylase